MSTGQWPFYDDDEVEAATGVLRAGLVNAWTGENIGHFEQEYAELLGRKHALAVQNGTLALELALRIAGVGPGDEVITTPRTFIATTAAIVLAGAKPVFADIDRNSQNVTAATMEPHITNRTRALLPVHHGGWPCAMEDIMSLAAEHNLMVIEDCAQAHGAAFKSRPAGAYGHIATFSFCQDKIITTAGEGGMVVCDDEGLWRSAWSFRDHGKNMDKVFSLEHPPGFRWVHDAFGSNLRMTEIQAAIGRRQLLKLDDWLARRRANAKTLRQEFEDEPALEIPWPGDTERHAFYRFYAYLRPEVLSTGWTRGRLLGRLGEAGAKCSVGSCPEVYNEVAGAPYRPATPLPVTREVGERSLAFEVHPTLSQQDMRRLAALVREVIAEARI